MAVSISLSITQNSQNITGNTSNVTVKVTAKWTNGSWNATGKCTGSITIDGTKHSFSGITFNNNQTTSGSKVIMTKTVNVSHNSDGTKNLSCSASFDTRVSSGVVSCSGSKTLTTIPRKSSLSASNGTLGTAQTLTVTRQATSFTHTITYKCGSASGTIATKSSDTSISWTPPLDLAKQNTTGTSVSVTLTITTYNGSTSIGSNTENITCDIPSSVKPSVSVSISDPAGYAAQYGGYYIQGLSKLKIAVTASGSQGATIKTYKIEADGKTYTAASVESGVIEGTGTLTIKVTVTDSRGRTVTASPTVTSLAYSAPKITALSTYRSDADGKANSSGSYLAVKFSGTVTSFEDYGLNTLISWYVKYKKVSETNYTTVEVVSDFATLTNHIYAFPADPSSSYDVILQVSDDFKSTSKATTGSSVRKLWSLLKKAGKISGIAIGKIAEIEDVLDIAMPVKFREGIIQNVLWSGEYYMTAGHTVTLSEPVSKQPSGIVLVFSLYDGEAAKNQEMFEFFVPKYTISAHSGSGRNFNLCGMFRNGVKYLYLHDDKITGHDKNKETMTIGGITYDNSKYVLRYVIGV